MVYKKRSIIRETLLRAFALSNLINIFIKSYIGTLSPICGCGIATEPGASASIVHLFKGSIKQMLGVMNNMVGSILVG